MSMSSHTPLRAHRPALQLAQRIIRKHAVVAAALALIIVALLAVQQLRDTRATLGARYVRVRAGTTESVVRVDAYEWSEPRDGAVTGVSYSASPRRVLVIDAHDAALIERYKQAPYYWWSRPLWLKLPR